MATSSKTGGGKTDGHKGRGKKQETWFETYKTSVMGQEVTARTMKGLAN
jgi:hypothetical protein